MYEENKIFTIFNTGSESTKNSRNACYYSVQNLLSSSLLSKKLKIKIYRTIILPVVLYGCETWSLNNMYIDIGAECLLLFGAESFIFQFAIQKVKDQDI